MSERWEDQDHSGKTLEEMSAEFEARLGAHVSTGCPWLTPTVFSLAQAAYENRLPDGMLDPGRLMVLADALDQAGCPAEVCERDPSHWRTRSEHTICAECDAWIIPHPLLAHLRSPGPHALGCWVIDLLLGFS